MLILGEGQGLHERETLGPGVSISRALCLVSAVALKLKARNKFMRKQS